MPGNYPLGALLGAVWVTACPSAYMLKLIRGSEWAHVEREICAFDSRLWPLKDGAVQHPSPCPLDQIRHVSPPILLHICASLTPALSCYLAFFILSCLSDCSDLTNEKGEDDARSHKMNDPRLESEEGKDEESKPTEALNCSPSLRESQINI